MKTIMIKAAVLLPVSLFAVYLLLVLFSGITCSCMTDASGYCSVFCLIAKSAIGVTLFLVSAKLGYDIYNFYRQRQNSLS